MVGDGLTRARARQGGEGFYVAQSGRCPDLLVIGGKRGFGGTGALADLHAQRVAHNLSWAR